MKNTKPSSNSKSDEFERFARLTKALVSVPKSEVDKKQEEYERAKKPTKRRKVA